MEGDVNNPPFYIGEYVIAVDALPGAMVKNGLMYRVYSCEYDRGQDNRFYWYVGVEGNGIKTHNRARPSIFASIQRPVLMTFEKLADAVPVCAN